MKAHIFTPTPEPRALLLWCFGPESDGYATVAAAAGQFGLTIRHVSNAELSATIGDLCAGKPAPDYAVLPALPATPAAIISGLRHDNGDLNSFVDAIHDAVLPIKASVTPTSKNWTLAQLLQELATEHEAMGAAQPEEQ